MSSTNNPLAPFIKGEFFKSPVEKGDRGIGVKLRNYWDGMDCRDALTGRLYVCPCLLVIHKCTKVTGDVASHLSPAGGG